MFDQVQVQALTGPLKNIQRLVPKPLLCCLGCVLRVVSLGHLLDQGPSLLIAGRVASYRKSLGGSKLVPLKNDGGHCVLGDLLCWKHFFGTLPKSLPRHNLVSELYGQFLRPHDMVFDLTCTVIVLLPVMDSRYRHTIPLPACVVVGELHSANCIPLEWLDIMLDFKQMTQEELNGSLIMTTLFPQLYKWTYYMFLCQFHHLLITRLLLQICDLTKDFNSITGSYRQYSL